MQEQISPIKEVISCSSRNDEKSSISLQSEVASVIEIIEDSELDGGVEVEKDCIEESVQHIERAEEEEILQDESVIREQKEEIQ